MAPDLGEADWRRLAGWRAAAELAGDGGRFAAAVFGKAFGEGAALPDAVLEALAGELALGDPRRRVTSGDGRRVLERNLDAALAAGAFGVPSFVVEDGELFWGQDRLLLLVHHLKRHGSAD